MAARVVRNLNASSSSGMASMVGTSRDAGPVSGGTAYEGASNQRGEPHGDGRRTFSSGHTYDGQWVDGRCHGFGTFTYPDGQVFEGEWEAGRRNGPGKLSMPNGETIAGTWVNDTLSGEVRRWNTAAEAPPVPVLRSARDHVIVEGPPPPVGVGYAAAVAAEQAAVVAAEQQAATDAAEMQWLKESHDVVWQLNVELQMENERLVGENRRLRLKLRQLLQAQNTAPAGVCQNTHSNCHGGCKGGHGTGHGGGNCGCEHCHEPKVVEGKLRRKKKADKGDGYDAAWIAKLLSEAGHDHSGHDHQVTEVVVPEEVPEEKRRRIAEELCERAEKELRDQLRLPHWSPIKRLDKPGEVERYAKHVLKNFLKRVRERPYDDRFALSEAANTVRDALAAVVNWPEGLERLMRRAKLDEQALMRTADLRLDGCSLGPGGAGAACVLVRASRQLRSLDLGSNGLGDVGATMLADALRSSTALQRLRLNDNGIEAAGGGALAAMLTTNHALQRADLRGNGFDDLSEAALRRAGGRRVVLNERELQGAGDLLSWSGGNSRPPSSSSASRDAEAFLSFTDDAPPPPPPPPPPPRASRDTSSRDADAFLAFGGNSAPPSSSGDAAAFLNFSGGSEGATSGGSGGGRSGSEGGTSEAESFLNFGGGGGGASSLALKSSCLSSSSSGRDKRVSFPAAEALGSRLGGNTCQASDLFGD